MRTDHLEIEGVLIAFLKGLRIDGVRAIYGVGDLSKVDENSITTPSLHVMYGGERLDGGAGKSEIRKVVQEWTVVIATDSSKNPISGDGNRASAGKIMSAVVNKLSGALLAPGYFEARRINSPAPYYAGTFAYFPLVYEIASIGG